MLFQPSPAAAQKTLIADEAFICMEATTQAEEKYQIQKHLLTSISTIETGQWNEKMQQKMAWPWTINVKGKGYYYKTKDEAIAAANEFRKRGINSFDVGCMQINMKFHGNKFSGLEEAFDPTANVEYAARYLNSLYSRRQNWMQAATDYHSKRPSKARIYKKKLIAAIEKVKQGKHVYATLYANAEPQYVVGNSNSAKQNWLSRLLWGENDNDQKEIKLSSRS